MKSSTLGTTRASLKPLVQFPLWEMKTPRITWINNGFDINRHLALRGIDQSGLRASFGNTDREEALRRQKLMKLMLADDGFRNACIDFNFTNLDIPRYGQAFVDYFKVYPHSTFWQGLVSFIEATGKTRAQNHVLYSENDALSGFVSHLRDQISEFEPLERDMARFVTDEMLKATSLDGGVSVDIGRESPAEDSKVTVTGINLRHVVGHRLYAMEAPDLDQSIDDFWDKSLFRFLGITQWLKNRKKLEADRNMDEWRSVNIITRAHEYVEEDISGYLRKILAEDESVNVLKAVFPKTWQSIRLMFRFSYRGEGLRLKLVGIDYNQTVPSDFHSVWNTEIKASRDAYFTPEQMRTMQELDGKLAHEAYCSYVLTNFYQKIFQAFKMKSPELVSDNGILIPSVGSDGVYRWEQATVLCELPEWKTIYERAKELRRYVRENMVTLREVAEIADKYKRLSETWGLPISFPDIIEGDKEAKLTFGELWPVSLIGRVTSGSDGEPLEAKDLRPIQALGDMSGQISILTGANGAGKTTMGDEILGALYDAGSGLPVFGKDVTLNLRTVIGTIYLEKGDGSTMQLSIVKLAKALRGVEKHPMNGTLIFWDEMGTGTTASQGEILGMASMTKLNRLGCTVIANTQIPALAERAQKAFGARCFKIDMNHQLTPGIGEPDIYELADLMGVSDDLGLRDRN